MKAVPEILTEDQWDKMHYLANFNKYHKTKVENWQEICPSLVGYISGLAYSEYTNWYIRKFSKLGRILE